MNLKKLTIIICLIWTAIVACWVIKDEYTLITGREVLLKTIPVDPKDLLMGDYVTLNYAISRIPYKFQNPDFYANEEVFVVLKIDENNIASIDNIVTGNNPPHSLCIKGKISKNNASSFRNARIVYGIESYYVKEHTGRILEKDLRNGALVRVRIDKYGNAKVKGFAENK